jgi:hypothetical protein
MFSRLRGQAAASPSKDEKVDLDSQSAEFLAGVALTGTDEALRIAAIERLSNSEGLAKLAGLSGSTAPAAVERAARSRLGQLIDRNELSFETCTARATDANAVLAVAAVCSDGTHLQKLVSDIQDTESLCKLAIEAPASKVRQLAAEALHDDADLRRVLKEIRGSDKNVYKIIKAKLDAQLAEEKSAAETQAHIHAIGAALERHSHLPFDHVFAPTLDHLNKQWMAVADHATPEMKSKIEQALDICRSTVTKHVQDIAAQAAQSAAVEQAQSQRDLLLDEMRKMLTGLYSGDSVDHKLPQAQQRWDELAGYKPPSKTESDTYAQLRKAIASLRDALVEHGSIEQQVAAFNAASQPASDEAALKTAERTLRQTLRHASLLGDAVPAAVVSANEALVALAKSEADKQASAAHAVRQLGNLIRVASSALTKGQSRQAAGMRRSIADKMAAISDIPEQLTKQLQALDQKLSELQDWKQYAVAPKRIELIEQMEALIGAEQAPQALAERIKQLQDEWKSISKGSVDNADAEWQRFHQAAQTAYLPCREYFAAQSAQRQGNLEKRKALLARLEQFESAHNWAEPDWREVSKALRESRQLWRNHQQVERAANKPVQQQFDALLSKMQTLLDAEYARNCQTRQTLIDRVQKLLELEDSRKATDEVKRLQSEWQSAGIVAREDDQRLWAEFRKHCDAVFQKRQQQHGAQVAAFDEAKNRAIELCESVERLASLTGAELQEGLKQLPSLRDAFDAVGELPRANAREITSRFERAVSRCEKSLNSQRARDKAMAWDHVLDASSKIRAVHLAQGAAKSALQQAALAYIESVQQWPKGALAAVKTELQKAENTAKSDLAANESALRTLCIRAEMLTNTPTPVADQAFKRSYQMQRLMQGFGQAESGKDDFESMVFEWLAVGAVDADVNDQLLARFKSCRAKAVG